MLVLPLQPDAGIRLDGGHSERGRGGAPDRDVLNDAALHHGGAPSTPTPQGAYHLSDAQGSRHRVGR